MVSWLSNVYTVLFSFVASSELKELLAKALKGSTRLIKVVIKDGG